MSTEKKYKRKRFFNYSIKGRLQFRMLFKIWMILFVSLLLAGIVFYFYSDINVGKSYRLFHVKAKNFLDFLLPVLVCGFVTSLVLGILVALFFPHAFAGPLHRIENELREIGKGDLSRRIALRKGSEVHELADAVNDMATGLREQVRGIKAAGDEINDFIQKVSPENVEESLRRLKEANGRLQESVNRFTI
jgi:methyl-accepting chemotaxis protein